MTYRVTGHISVSTYMFSCRLILYLLPKVYVQGLLWRHLHSSTRFAFFIIIISACISSVCASVFHQLCGCLSVPQLCLFCAQVLFSEVCIPQISSGLYTCYHASFCLSVFEYMCMGIHVYLGILFCKLHVNCSV